MSTIQTRLDNLQAAHARNNQRKGNSEADWLEGTCPLKVAESPLPCQLRI